MPVIPFNLEKEINDVETNNDHLYIIFTTLSMWCLLLFIGYSKNIHSLEKEHNF
jgi:hypothetical protein